MRTLLLPITLLVTGCVAADPELGTLTETEAASAYSTMKAQLKDVYSIVLGGTERPPTEYEYGCTSGTIELRLAIDAEMQPTVLQNGFSECEINTLTFDGTIFYRNIDPCDDAGGMAMSVYGRIDLKGSMDGFCEIQARDNCGELSGHVCGFPAGDLDISSDAAP